MNAVLFILIFVAVLAAAAYSRLPFTIVFMTSIVAFMTSLTPHGEPLNSMVHLFRIPAVFVTNIGDRVFGVGAPVAAGTLLIGTLFADIVLTKILGARR